MSITSISFFAALRLSVRLLVVLFFATASFAIPAASANQTFSLSIVPQFSPINIGLRWTPLLQRLEAETGYGFQLRLVDKIPRFETDFLTNAPDLLYLNPYHMIMAAKAHQYIPLIRGSEPLAGILVVDVNSPVKNLQDLNGKQFAFPAPNAFGASLYLRALLSEKEKIDVQANYVGTHQNVYRHVAIGDAVAGGGIEATLEKEPLNLRKRLRVLYTTPGVAPHPFAAHPRIPLAVREKITAAFLKIGQDAAGQKLLSDVELSQVIRADYARDYLPLEKLKLERYTISN
jgi:phosphonate transport system substrate-binding protein